VNKTPLVVAVARARFLAALGRVLFLVLVPTLFGASAPRDLLPPTAGTVPGYIALLLINETPFPGERAWVSEEDTKAAMLAILWVVHSRLKIIPPGYRQEHITAERCDDIIDVITAGGGKGQCDGFYRDGSGRMVAARRVHKRVDSLFKLASNGKPGRFARLLQYAEDLADAYVKDGVVGADGFAQLARVNGIPVTGRAYAWMSDRAGRHPGGNFVKITDDADGSLGGNRFFTLRKLK
jgi:hypothetical protein